MGSPSPSPDAPGFFEDFGFGLMVEVAFETGIQAPPNQLEVLFASRPEVLAEIKERGLGDPVSRVKIRNVIAEELTGGYWPNVGAPQQARQAFIEELEDAVKRRRGWEIGGKRILGITVY